MMSIQNRYGLRCRCYGALPPPALLIVALRYIIAISAMILIDAADVAAISHDTLHDTLPRAIIRALYARRYLAADADAMRFC